MKVIIILRHAKAVPTASGLEDHGRALLPVGEKAAQQMGVFMREQGYLPQRVLCSTAQRARQTLEHWQKGAQASPAVEYIERLYLAAPAEIWHRVHEVKDSVNSLMVVGHNPGLHLFCAEAAGQGAEEDMGRLSRKFPTAAAALLQFPGIGWKQAQPGEATLLRFVTPKQLSVGLEDQD